MPGDLRWRDARGNGAEQKTRSPARINSIDREARRALPDQAAASSLFSQAEPNCAGRGATFGSGSLQGRGAFLADRGYQHLAVTAGDDVAGGFDITKRAWRRRRSGRSRRPGRSAEDPLALQHPPRLWRRARRELPAPRARLAHPRAPAVLLRLAARQARPAPLALGRQWARANPPRPGGRSDRPVLASPRNSRSTGPRRIVRR